jgi:tetratricopeptide (TPR) repeat protein
MAMSSPSTSTRVLMGVAVAVLGLGALYAWKRSKPKEPPTRTPKKKNKKGIFATPETPLHTPASPRMLSLNDSKRRSEAISLSKEATQHYNDKRYTKAIECLSKAILLQESFKYYTNRAFIYIHEKEYENAYADSSASVQIQPTPKGYSATTV